MQVVQRKRAWAAVPVRVAQRGNRSTGSRGTELKVPHDFCMYGKAVDCTRANGCHFFLLSVNRISLLFVAVQ